MYYFFDHYSEYDANSYKLKLANSGVDLFNQVNDD